MMLVRLGVQAASAMAELHAAAFPRAWGEGDFSDLVGGFGMIALGAEDKGALGGLILVQAVAGEAEILTLAVRPAARRQGWARGLVEAAAITAAGMGARQLWLEVAEDNLAALALYRRAGFSEAGRRPGYYQSAGDGRIDALVMRRALNSPGDSAYSR
jgi:ribosomal-protein-alanine N-acetyltransferase